jgi:hypothetical protein
METMFNILYVLQMFDLEKGASKDGLRTGKAGTIVIVHLFVLAPKFLRRTM